MQIFDDYYNEIIRKDDLLTIMQLVESYVFRRAICQIPTNSLNKTFATLSKEINKNKYIESLKAAFLLKGGYTRFPSDEEFRNQFATAQIYNLRIADYTLRKLENYKHKKEPVTYENYTVEHIMPQKEDLTEQWIKDLGNDWENIHTKYLHTIGNLTLTGYNPELGTKSFKEKRDGKGGYSSSPLYLNKDIATFERWTQSEIEQRANTLTDLAIQIWPAPTLDDSTLAFYRQTKELKGRVTYTEEQHIEDASDHIRRLYEALKPAILSLGADISIIPQKHYIGFYRKTNFVDIVVYKSQLNLYLNMMKGTLSDSRFLTRDVSIRGHWGNGDYAFILKDFRDLDYALSLIKQSYDNN